MPPRLSASGWLGTALGLSVLAHAAEIKGTVSSAVGGESLGQVAVAVLGAKPGVITSDSGEFDIANLKPGVYTLRLDAVGYRLLTVPFTLTADSDVKEFSITMVPDNFHHTDKVEVRADAFEVVNSAATTGLNLTSSEIRETSTVFADDPFRAVQSLPGVSAEGNNEFFAEFSVMGAPFSSVSIYIDDVLVQNPFHEIGNYSDGASLGVLTSEVVEEMNLLPAAYPEKFGDADGAALDMHTREGSRGAPRLRVSAGIAATEILGEGALGAARTGSWLLSARKSYINYLIRSRVENASDVGFEDADLKLSYDITPKQNLALLATEGHTHMAMTDPADLTVFEYDSGRSDFTLARTGWRWSVSPRLLLDAHAAYLREPDQLFNTANLLLSATHHGEWSGGAALHWAWNKAQLLQAGWSERRVADSMSETGFALSGATQVSTVAGTGLRQSGYLQQSSEVFGGRIHLLGSLRWDSLSGYDFHPLSPQLSLAAQLTHSTSLQLGAGRYQQFATRVEPTGLCVGADFMPEKSDHGSAAIERRWGENTRLRLLVFDRQDSQTFGVIPDFNPGSPSACPAFEPFSNSTYQRDYSRGVQLVLQKRSANRLSGWLGYTLVQARERQYEVSYPVTPIATEIFSSLSTPYYPTLEDQRSSLSAFGTYRLRPTLNLSGKFVFGSGVPVPSGAYIQLSNGQYLPVGLNATRLGAYARLDLRADKDWVFRRSKLTLYGEILNLTNHYNGRYFYQSGINPTTGQAQVVTLQGLPVTPTVGLVFQF